MIYIKLYFFQSLAVPKPFFPIYHIRSFVLKTTIYRLFYFVLLTSGNKIEHNPKTLIRYLKILYFHTYYAYAIS